VLQFYYIADVKTRSVSYFYLIFSILVLGLEGTLNAQYFVDILSVNTQFYHAKSLNQTIDQQTQNSFINVFAPIVRPSGNTLLFRLSAEQIDIRNESQSIRAKSVMMPFGKQWILKNSNWRFSGLLIPKFAGLESQILQEKNFQLGVYALAQYSFTDSLRVKFGFYINREFFGNLYVPLLGLDYQINQRWSMYGMIPSSFRISYNLKNNKLHTGIGLKTMARSFKSEQGDQFLRYNELQAKYFIEATIARRWVCFAEAGYFLGRAPLLYNNDAKKKDYVDSNLLQLMQPFPIFNFGMAFRVFQ
jgi:hypothetical protein